MDYVLKINSNIVINLEQNISEKDEVYDSIVQSSLNNIEIEIYKDKDIHIEEIILNVGGEIFLPDSVTENIIENPLKKKIIYNFGKKRFFACIWGYCRVSIEIINKEKSIYTYYSPLINISLSYNDEDNERLKDSAKNMVKFIFDNNQYLLQTPVRNKYSLVKNDLKINNFKTLFTEVEMLKKIVECYNINYRYFSVDLKYKLINSPKIDKFEKLRKVTPETIKYIIENMDELEQVEYSTGIRYLNRNFKPKNILISEQTYDYNIYENQVVLGFIKFLIDYLEERLENIRVDSEKSTFSKNDIKQILFEYYIFYNKEIKSILLALQSIYCQYKNLMKDLNPIYNFENIYPTNIFLRNHNYRAIYNLIEEWFQKGNYNFDDDKIITSFVTIDQIYEYYCLLNIINTIEKTNFNLVNSYNYKYNDINYIYKGENTFEFIDNLEGNNKITLYYQPAIYTYKFENNISLYRVNGRKTYYLPDFLIKIEGDSVNKLRYIILDAKWQNRNDINKYSLDKIINRYAFSLQGDENSIIENVFILQGKDDVKEIYRYQNSELAEIVSGVSHPIIEIIPFTPKYNNSDYLNKKLNDMLLKIK